MTTETLRKVQASLTNNYDDEISQRLSEWKENKEQVLDAIFDKQKQEIEDKHETAQLELERQLQNKLAHLKVLLNNEES